MFMIPARNMLNIWLFQQVQMIQVQKKLLKKKTIS